MRHRTIAALALVPFMASALANAAGGDADPGFAYQNPTEAIPDSTNAVAMPDGGLIIVTSRPDPAPATTSTLDLVRIDAGGAAVSAFGAADGRLRLRLPVRLNVSLAAVRDSAGRIVLGGYEVGDPAPVRKASMVRIDEHGQLDPAFGEQGIVRYDAPGDADRIEQLAVLSDGRILAGVHVELSILSSECIPDRTSVVEFDSNGRVATPLTEFNGVDAIPWTCSQQMTLLVRPDGEIIAGNRVGVRVLLPPHYTTVIPVPGPEYNVAAGPFREGMVATFVVGEFMRTYRDDPNEPNRGHWLDERSVVNPPWLPLAAMAGLDDSSLNLNLIVSASFGSYVGFSTESGQAGVASFGDDGNVRTGWGGGDGVVPVPAVPTAASVIGAAGAVRKLFVQPNDDVIVVTSNGFVRKLLGTTETAHGGFALERWPSGVPESTTTYTLHVSRTGGSIGAVSVKYRVASVCDTTAGSGCLTQGYVAATENRDFEPAAGEFFWADGDTTDKIIQVKLLDDGLAELVETFFVQLSQPAGGATILTGTLAFSINTSDQPTSVTRGGDGDPDRHSGGGGALTWPLAMLLLVPAFAARLRSTRRDSRRVRSDIRVQRPAYARWILSCLLLLPAIALAQARPGDVDPTFVFPFPDMLEPDTANLVPMPDGWLVVKSRVQSAPQPAATLELTRIDRDGRTVASFGNEGVLTQVMPSAVNVATAVKRTDSGQVWLAGFKSVANGSEAAIALLDPAGRLDTSFADGGVLAFDVPGENDRIGAIDVLPDGRLIAMVWSRTHDYVYDCSPFRTTVVVIETRVGSPAVTAGAFWDGDSWATSTCRTTVTLQVSADGTVLLGNESGIFSGLEPATTALFSSSSRFGPFADVPNQGLVFTTVSGDGVSIELGSRIWAVSTNWGFGRAVAMENFAWNRMAVDTRNEVLYLGMASDEGDVAIARFIYETGTLDTGWAGGLGIARVHPEPRETRWVDEGLATEVRYLAVQPDGKVVVATADGIVRRLLGGSEARRGAFRAQYLDDLIARAPKRTVNVVVERVGGSEGIVSVDYSVEAASCTGTPPVPCAYGYNPATDGEDFRSSRGTLTWVDGERSHPIPIEILDPKSQGTEYFVLKLSNATGGAGVLSPEQFYYLSRSAPSASTPPPPSSGQPESRDQKSGGGGSGWTLLALLVLLAVRTHERRNPMLMSQVSAVGGRMQS